MRILYLVPESWPTYRADIGALFGRYLPRHGIVADLVTGHKEGAGDATWRGGQSFFFELTGSPVANHFLRFFHALRVLSTAKADRYDAIQVRDMPLIGLLGSFAARVKGRPFIYWISYPMSEGQIVYAKERGLSMGLLKFLFPWVRGHLGCLLLYRFIFKRVTHLFVQSDRMRHELVLRGADPARMTVVPMGVDLEVACSEMVSPIRDSRLEGRRVLVYLGTLGQSRRIELLFEVLALVKAKIPSAILLLVGDAGDNPHRKWLEGKSRDAGVEKEVVWTGWVPAQEAWRYVRAAEVGLSLCPRGPILDVGSPTKVLEYLALGVPVVCNDNPDQQGVILQSGAGICVPYGANEFAAAILSILEKSPAERERMVMAGKSYVANKRSYARLAEHVAQSYVSIAGISSP